MNLINMAWRGIDNVANTGGDTDVTSFLTFPSLDFPEFWGLVLFSFFAILTLRLFYKQKETAGKGDFISSSAVSSFATSLLGLVLNLAEVIDRTILIFTLSITFVFVAIYFLTKD